MWWWLFFFYFVLLPIDVTWHGCFRGGKGKVIGIRLLLLGQHNVPGQWARLPLLLCIHLLSCMNRSSLNTPFLGGKKKKKKAFLPKVVVFRYSFYRWSITQMLSAYKSQLLESYIALNMKGCFKNCNFLKSFPLTRWSSLDLVNWSNCSYKSRMSQVVGPSCSIQISTVTSTP